MTNALAPVPVPDASSGIAEVSAGGGGDYIPSHTCVVTTASGVRCWGAGASGQLGNNVLAAKSTAAVDVSGLSTGVEHVSAGGEHTCAVTESGGVRCWGSNGEGQIGDGTQITRPEPVRVLVP